MAKSKIVWSNRAKKRLYGILEFYIGRDKSKTFAIKFHKLLKKEVKLLVKFPELGIKTTEDRVRGLVADKCIVFYEVTGDKIIIHTISDTSESSSQSPGTA